MFTKNGYINLALYIEYIQYQPLVYEVNACSTFSD